MSTTVTVNQHQAVDLLNEIEDVWEIKGGKFFNDYAALNLYIDDMDSKHRLILHRNGTWEFKIEVTL